MGGKKQSQFKANPSTSLRTGLLVFSVQRSADSVKMRKRLFEKTKPKPAFGRKSEARSSKSETG
ncbi:MAG: hypothetical protein A2Z38_11510 [Planctomycetes bacterium RBG_19FT_COMBO_48_8]|nr:MAG: hypothetical protein A2Z38_11510 [Planctomycetes bacterium RBG_19FT_COMBO_48_8]